MIPPIFQLVVQSAAATSLLGTNPTRFWPFAEAPRDANGVPSGGAPYALWQTAYGSPFNSLSCTPSEDQWGVQVDVYATTAESARAVAAAIRDAVEGDAYIVSWNGESKDEPTGLFRIGFTVEFITER